MGRTSAFLLPLATLLLLGGCSTLSVEEREFRARVSNLFEEVYSEVAEVHLEPVNFEQFTIKGLAGLRRIDPTLFVTHDAEARSIALMTGKTEILKAPLPESNDLLSQEESQKAWSQFASALVLRARNNDPMVASASEEALYDAFFTPSMRTLDAFSRYTTAEDEAQSKAAREGYGGIGVRLSEVTNGVRIDMLEPGAPAIAAGLAVGDVVAAINGHDLKGIPVSDAQNKLRGPIDTAVQLRILRDGLPDPMQITVGRARIVPNTVFWERRGDTAVIRISGFNQRTSKRISEAVSQARSEIGSHLDGLVLDLRGNLGGLLDQAVDSADLFLEGGLISKADGRHPESVQSYRAEPGDIAHGLPMVTLVDGSTASAAEILAAALQDHGRAPVIGMTTFGKGTIQTVLDLPNGGALYITWARFLAPSGYALETYGVMPTICTSGTADAVETIEESLTSGSRSARNRLQLRRKINSAAEEEVAELQNTCPWLPHASGDIDLSIAQLLMESPTMLRRALVLSRFQGGS